MRHILLFSVIAFLGACNLSKDIEIELPAYDRQPVVECYLEPGRPFRLLLTQSYAFFDPFALDSSFLQRTLLQNALVTISYDGRTDTLPNQLTFDLSPARVFNYTGTNIVPATIGQVYQLRIVLSDGGGEITSSATMLSQVKIDSVVVEFNPSIDTLGRMLTYITDDQSQANFYRRLLNYTALDSFPDQDFLVTDRFSTTPSIAFGTGYELAKGDTVFNSIYHLSPDYYDYLESVQLAISGNLNPFAQPSPIKSNVSGTANPLGIFTCLVYDRIRTIVE